MNTYIKNILEKDHNDLCVGIDLGTTNSVLATVNRKPNGDIISKVIDIPRFCDIYNSVMSETRFSSVKKPTLPSFVYYREEKNYEPIVGDFARNQYPLRPHLVSKSIKSQMGNSEVEGLSYDIPDKNPEQVSARILQHLIRGAEKVYRCSINDAIITVPANFDSAMCKATRDAAEMAGIKVQNSDGTERAVLLSEPNAVIYDLVNQIKNGEISDCILDLSEKRNVMVFDIGGGTLDITMHEIKRKDNDIIHINEIATNRYTRLGGDDFDEKIAEYMYQRYLAQYNEYPDAIRKITKEKDSIMAQLRVYAENMKIEVSNSSESFISGWDYDDEDEIFYAGGNMGGIGYSYDDSFTKNDIENILSSFMGNQLNFDDFRNLDNIEDTRNIIFPILDVLKKASNKLSDKNIKIDAVVVNGGMSKFYMITERLKSFFGFDPIVALDPDQSVARGAAIYHYYLHRHEELQNSMIKAGDSGFLNESISEENNGLKEDIVNSNKKIETVIPVEWGKSILNDALYLGSKNGAVEMIIPTGAELPYESEIITGYKIEAGQKEVSIPIKSRNIDGTYRIIGNGKMYFVNEYDDGAYVSFNIKMNNNKVITMDAWTSYDLEGKERIEYGKAVIDTSEIDKKSFDKKIVSRTGEILIPEYEINNLERLCINFGKDKNLWIKSSTAKRIAAATKKISKAGNRDDFADIIIEKLKTSNNLEFKMRLVILARKICLYWNEDDRAKLAKVCRIELLGAAYGIKVRGEKSSLVMQTIITLGVCGDSSDEELLKRLHADLRYRHALLYAHSRTQTDINWIKMRFDAELMNLKDGRKNSFADSVYFLGMALRKNGKNLNVINLENKIVNDICMIIKSGKLNKSELVNSILALGWICDQRYIDNRLNCAEINKVRNTIENLDYIYPEKFIMYTSKSQKVAKKMMEGSILSREDEEFLLTKLEY